MRIKRIDHATKEFDIVLHNCYYDEIEINFNYKNVHFVRIQEISGDEVLTTYDKDLNVLSIYDSDRHWRCLDFNDFDEMFKIEDFIERLKIENIRVRVNELFKKED